MSLVYAKASFSSFIDSGINALFKSFVQMHMQQSHAVHIPPAQQFFPLAILIPPLPTQIPTKFIRMLIN